MAFEFFNDCYPDVDDSAVILSVLAHSRVADTESKERSNSRGRKLGDGNAVEGRRLCRVSIPTTTPPGSITSRSPTSRRSPIRRAPI